ncbi:MAG: hypothetical protein Q9174_002699 [Haloplaca sp. 1 TL-2023]
MTDSSYPRLLVLWQFLSILATQLVSGHALPANPLSGPNPPTLSLLNHNALTLTQNIGNLVTLLAGDPSGLYSRSQLVDCEIAVEFYQHGSEVHDLYVSSNISEFRDINCAFRFGEPKPDGLPSYFLVENKYPDHWDQWSLPLPLPDTRPDDMPQPFAYSEVQNQLSVERADQLLKAAGHEPGEGYDGAYDWVTLRRTSTNEVTWCFQNVQGHYPDTAGQHDFNVYVSTGRVEQIPHCEGIIFDVGRTRSRVVQDIGRVNAS